MRYVLFVCTHNAGRSQMAQAFFERYAPAGVPTTVETWDIPDPAGQPIERVRGIRDAVRGKAVLGRLRAAGDACVRVLSIGQRVAAGHT